MTRWMSFLLLAVCFAVQPWSANAASFPDKPPSSDFFVDQGRLLDVESAGQINSLAAGLLQDERVPLFVVTISSLASFQASGQTIEGYARALFDHWGIGYQDRNYGILLLVSVGDRKARIELGADWGGSHDAQASDIMQNLIIPAFKRGDYRTGIVDGVRGLDAMARGLQLPKPTAPFWFWPALIGGGILIVLMIVNLFRSGRKGWAWAIIAALGVLLFFVLRAAASGGGSGGGFGGGSGGGGGATGSW